MPFELCGSTANAWFLQVMALWVPHIAQGITAASDSLPRTLDQDSYSGGHCAQQYEGAWWFNSCFRCKLNGRYIAGGHTSSYQGIIWNDWKGYEYSLKRTEMKIRPNY